MSDDGSKSSADKSARSQFDQFFGAVGFAISQWADVDTLLFSFFQFCVSTQDEKAATIFYSAPTISLHAEMVDKLMNLSLSSRHLARWKKLKAEMDSHLSFRNHLAHDPHRFSPWEDYTLADLTQKRAARERLDPYEIVTPQLKLWAKKKAKGKRTRFAEVGTHIVAVHFLLNEMQAFRDALPRRARKQRAKLFRPSAPGKKAPRQKRRSGPAKR